MLLSSKYDKKQRDLKSAPKELTRPKRCYIHQIFSVSIQVKTRISPEQIFRPIT